MPLACFITQSNLCTSKDELVAAFEKALSELGLSKFIYCMARGSFSGHGKVHHGIARSYPEDWVKHYLSNNYVEFDATYRHGLNSCGAFSWKTLHEELPLTKKEKLVLGEAEDAGLKNGITVSLHGPHGEVMGFGFACEDRQPALSKDQMSYLYCLANQFHLVYSSLSKTETPQPIKLSDRQREILQWAAGGKSRSSISEIMAISEDTVDDHFRHIFRKLGCNDRIVAVLKAIQWGLIRV